MPASWKNCEQCGGTYWAVRSSSRFCGGSCRAKFFREHGKGHNDDRREYGFRYGTCEHCGHEFLSGKYSYRSGDRQQRYCSDKCRYAANAAKKKQGAKKNTNDKKENRNPEGSGSKKGNHSSGSQPQQNNTTNQQNELPGHVKTLLGKSCYAVFNWADGENAAKNAKSEYRKLIREYHPDVCKEWYANQVCSFINAQWEKLAKWEGIN